MLGTQPSNQQWLLITAEDQGTAVEGGAVGFHQAGDLVQAAAKVGFGEVAQGMDEGRPELALKDAVARVQRSVREPAARPCRGSFDKTSSPASTVRQGEADCTG